jgi:hypothetical protein
MENGGNSLLVFPQSSRLGYSAHHPLVAAYVHGAKLRFSFSTQCYLSQKSSFAFSTKKVFSAVR